MPSRNYSNTAVETELNGGITNVATSLVVNDATGYPAVPFTIQINDEVILVGAKSGTTFSSLTRGYDNTTGVAHSNNDRVKHVGIAKDFDDRPESTEVLLLSGGTMAGAVDFDNNNLLGVDHIEDDFGNQILMGNAAGWDIDIVTSDGDIYTDSDLNMQRAASGTKALQLFISGPDDTTFNHGTEIFLDSSETAGRAYYMHLKGTGETPANALDIGQYDASTYKTRIRFEDVNAGTGDITFFKADGTTQAMRWDQDAASGGSWDLNRTYLDNVEGIYDFYGNAILMGDFSGNSNIDIYTNNAGVWTDAHLDMITSGTAQMYIYMSGPDSSGTGRGTEITLDSNEIGGPTYTMYLRGTAQSPSNSFDIAQISTGYKPRIRLYDITGATTGDLEFFKADGSTSALLWDESANEWVYPSTATVVGGVDQYVAFSIGGDLETGARNHRWYPPVDITVLDMVLSVGTAPTGAAILFDVHKSGTTIFTTQGNRPTVAIGGFVDTAAVPDVTSVTTSEYLTVEVDQIGSTVAGADATLTIRYRNA